MSTNAARPLPQGVYLARDCKSAPYRATIRVRMVHYSAGNHPTVQAAVAARRERHAVILAALKAGSPVPPYRPPAVRPKPAPVRKYDLPPKPPARNPRCRPLAAEGDDLATLRRYARLREGDRTDPEFTESMAAVVAVCRRHEAVVGDGRRYELDSCGDLYVTPYRPHP